MLLKISSVTLAAAFALATPAFAIDDTARDPYTGEMETQEGVLGGEELYEEEQPLRDEQFEEDVVPFEQDSPVEEDLYPSERELQQREHDLREQELDLREDEQELRIEEDELDEAAVPGETVVLRPEPVRAREMPNTVIELEGGYNEFTGELRDQITGGGNWGLRGVFGASNPLAIELGYMGTANGYANPRNDNTAITSSGEVLARLNLAARDAMVKPFLAAGANYFRIDATDLDELEAGAGPLDGVQSIGFPLSAGINLHPTQGFTIGARGNYKILTGLVDDDMPNGNNWNVGLTLGAAF